MNATLELHGRDSTTEHDVDEIERISRSPERPGRPADDQPDPTERFRFICEGPTRSPPRVGESVGILITARAPGLTGEDETVTHYVYGRVEALGAHLIVTTYERDFGGDETLNALAKGALPIPETDDAERGASA